MYQKLFQLGVIDILAKLVRNDPQGLDGDCTGAVTIVEREDLHDVLTAVLVINFLGEESDPLSEVDGSVAVTVKIGNHVKDSTVLGLKSERNHGCLEL